MTKTLLSILISLGSLLQGQNKICGVFNSAPTIVTCELTSTRTLRDTSFALIPTACNNIQFDKSHDGVWKVQSVDSSLHGIYTVKKGQLHGLSIEYYANGQLKSITSYRFGRLHGTISTFDSTGRPRESGYYDKRGFTGRIYSLYWDNGQLAMQTEWKNNARSLGKGEQFWDRTGKEIDAKQFDTLYYDCN